MSELKQDFEVINSLGEIIDVLKTGALIQFRSFQLKEKPNDDFLKEIEFSLRCAAGKEKEHPYFFDRSEKPSCIVIITSDEGFLGDLNTQIINAALDRRRSREDEVVVVGERGVRYLEDIRQNFLSFSGISDDITPEEVGQLKNYLLKNYKSRFGRVFLIYPKFVSLSIQKVTPVTLLPYPPLALEGDYASLGHILKEELLLEPEPTRVLESLAELALGFTIRDIFWSSKQAELAARITHLEGSTQEMGFLKQKLSLDYFRQVHMLRDKVIREISASKSLLGKRRAKARRLLAESLWKK